MTDTGSRTWSDPANPAVAEAVGIGLSFLKCPRCGESLAVSAATRIECTVCHAAVATSGGIIDFVAGTSATALDDIDYDQFYAVNLQSSLDQYKLVKTSAGRFWPQTLGNAVEIGCGTGGFSMAILTQCSAAHGVLTDVSIKMLGICRARLDRLGTVQANGLTFVTYSGTETCFAPDAFDTCFGTFVLHHVIDVPRLLKQVHQLLKPGGRAFFMEPNLPFHRALTVTLASILGKWINDAAVPDLQMSIMLNWMAEVHCNIVNSGETEVLAEREDKHLFVAETFKGMAQAAGFTSVVALPCGPDPTGSGAIGVYLSQCGVNDATFRMLWQAWPAAQEQHFSALAPQDCSPSYLFWLAKGHTRQAGRRRPDNSLEHASTRLVVGPVLPMHLFLEVSIRRNNDISKVVVNGWCAAVERVKSVEITVGEQHSRLPIWRPRPDVQKAVNKNNTYPPLHALCSGIDGTIPLTTGQAKEAPTKVQVDVVAVDGRILPGKSIILLPNGEHGILDLYQPGLIV